MSKRAYEPHPRLSTRVVPSETEYSRAKNRQAIEEELASEDPTNEMESDSFFNAEGDRATAEEMYEHGFSIIMPETR
jgi:hypothetical protein